MNVSICFLNRWYIDALVDSKDEIRELRYPFSIYRSPVAVDNTLYWGSVQFDRGYDDIHIHARAYDLDSSTALSTFFAAASITQFFWRMNFW